jgi:hypothetical protein
MVGFSHISAHVLQFMGILQKLANKRFIQQQLWLHWAHYLASKFSTLNTAKVVCMYVCVEGSWRPMCMINAPIDTNDYEQISHKSLKVPNSQWEELASQHEFCYVHERISSLVGYIC